MIQMAKQRTRDRNLLIADLDSNLAKLSISISFDGGMMFEKIFSCGISSQDTTQHRIFNCNVSIVDECPIGPTQLTIIEVGDLAKSYMKGKGIDLTSDKYAMFVVSPLQQDVRKANTTNQNTTPSLKNPTMKSSFRVHQQPIHAHCSGCPIYSLPRT